jgi:tellurite resistance protein TerC
MDFLLPFFTADFMGKPAWVWLTFVGIVIALLAFDLGVLHKDDREIGVRESLLLSAGYISVALLFGAWVWWYLGAQSGMDYYTGFMIEKSLSMDNVFVIALIFGFFAIPRQYQHRVLFWGILGVIVLRAIMIGLGATLVSQFSWVLYLFGAFLIFTGIKLWIIADPMPDIANNPLLKFLKRHMHVTEGLRALYSALAAMIHRFKYLKHALAMVLVFIGKIPAAISLSVTFGLIAGGVLVSPWKTRGQPAVAEPT